MSPLSDRVDAPLLLLLLLLPYDPWLRDHCNPCSFHPWSPRGGRQATCPSWPCPCASPTCRCSGRRTCIGLWRGERPQQLLRPLPWWWHPKEEDLGISKLEQRETFKKIKFILGKLSSVQWQPVSELRTSWFPGDRCEQPLRLQLDLVIPTRLSFAPNIAYQQSQLTLPLFTGPGFRPPSFWQKTLLSSLASCPGRRQLTRPSQTSPLSMQ